MLLAVISLACPALVLRIGGCGAKCAELANQTASGPQTALEPQKTGEARSKFSLKPLTAGSSRVKLQISPSHAGLPCGWLGRLCVPGSVVCRDMFPCCGWGGKNLLFDNSVSDLFENF